MPTNKYFNHLYAKNEQKVFTDLVYEAIRIHGVDVVYIKREYVEIDEVLREPKQSTFKETYVVEMYIPDTGQGGGDQSFMSKFGFRFQETSEAILSIRAWDEANTGMVRPREGDVIYIGNPDHIYDSFMNTAFEIKQVHMGMDDDFQKGGRHAYRLTLESFTPSYEKFETEYDQVNTAYNVNDEYEIMTAINEVSTKKTDELLVPSKNPFGEL